jgi:hypothetical protein
MPKKTPFPRLRSHVRKGAHGQVWCSWYYDGRPDGEKDTPLGSDYEQAIVRWRELHEHKPRIAGTLQEAFERWSVEVLPTYSSIETRKGYARSLKIITPGDGAPIRDLGVGHDRGTGERQVPTTRSARMEEQGTAARVGSDRCYFCGALYSGRSYDPRLHGSGYCNGPKADRLPDSTDTTGGRAASQVEQDRESRRVQLGRLTRARTACRNAENALLLALDALDDAILQAGLGKDAP